MKQVTFAEGIRPLLRAIAQMDRQVLGMTMLMIAEEGEKPSADVSFSEVEGLGFGCREAAINQGRKGIGLLSIYTTEFGPDEIVVLFAKEGAPGNLSIQDRNRIREMYQSEMESRGHKP